MGPSQNLNYSFCPDLIVYLDQNTNRGKAFHFRFSFKTPSGSSQKTSYNSIQAFVYVLRMHVFIIMEVG